MSWKKVKLGDVCNIEKGKTGILKAIPGEFPLVVTADERKSHNEYQFDGEAVIIPLVSGTGHGHASIKRLHFQSGKFALGSILCAVIPKNKNILNTEYLFRFLVLNKDRELVDRMKGMANVTLPIKEIAKIEIPLPSLKEQNKFVEKYSLLENDSQHIYSEFHKQLDFVKQLRQAFLREAIQGKLIKSANTKETGQQLLEKIKAEKAQLIAEKKLKKEKELPKITEDEIPFDIPVHWTWCRLGDISNLKSGNQYSYPKSGNGIMYVKVGDMNIEGNEKEIVISSNYFIKEFVKDSDLIKTGSIIFPKRGGAIATNKRRIVGKEPILIDSNTMAVSPNKRIDFGYFLKWFSGVDLSKFGNEGVIPQINNKDLNPLLIPLPPLSEQGEIVTKLNELSKLCNDLEQNIIESSIYNNQLLQQVLREALQPKEKVLNVDSLFVNKNYDLYVAMMQKLIENQLHINYGEVATQKTVFHLNTFTDEKIPYTFMNSNYGTYSFQLKDDLTKNPYLTKSKIGNGEVFVVKPNKEKEIKGALAKPENKSFVDAVKKVLKIYENPVINKETEKVELLNTVSKMMIDFQTSDLETVYEGMRNWEIKQKGFKNKAEKFSKNQTKEMIRLIEKLGLISNLIN